MLLRAAASSWVLLLACGPEPSSAVSAKPTPSLVADSPSTLPAAETTKPSKPTCSLPAGESARAITIGDTPREYLLHVGSELSDPPAVVFAWHGFGSRAELSRAALEGPQRWSDAIVVAPRGLPRTFEQFGDTARAGWQIASGELEDRDLALFDGIVAELSGLGCLDPARVYTTGFSNGGFFSNVLACHRGEVIAAAAPVGGGGPFVLPCGPSVPVLVTHGRVDQVVPYASATQTFGHWARHNGCADDATAPADGCAAAASCPADAVVRMCSEDLGHRWPRGQGARVAEFLRRFGKGGAQGPDQP